MDCLVPARIEGVRSPREADQRTLRLCASDQDAVLASIRLSGLTYREIAARMDVSKSAVNAWANGDRPLPPRRVRAFCNSTSTLLLVQYRELQRALDEAAGRIRKADRIAAIVAPTERKWAAA